MDEAWWEGYESGMSGEGTNPYPLGARATLWQIGKVFGCNALAAILENMMLNEDRIPVANT